MDDSGRIRELILLAKQGDERAFAGIMSAYGKAVFRLALAITGNSADAEDASQDAFLRAFRSLDRFDADRPFGPWIMKIAANRAITWAQRRPKTAPLEEALEAPEGPLADDAGLREALQRLSPEDRAILALRYEQGQSVSEIAQALGIREGAVKVRLFRARERLMDSMKEGE